MSTGDLLAAAVAHHKAGRLDQAASLYDTILAEQPIHAEALHNSALIALQRGDRDEAVRRLRDAIAAAPGRAVAHNDLGAALRLSGRLPEAAQALERAVATDPSYADAWNNLGIVRRAMGELAPARDALGRAAQLKPHFAPTFNALGVVHKGLGESVAALAAFDRAVSLQPDYPEALTNLGLALLDDGQPAEAMAPLRKAAELAPALAEVWLNLGLAQRGSGDLRAAAASLRRAVAAKPDLAPAWNALGVVLATDGDHAGASDALARAVRLTPSAEFLSNYGLSLYKTGRNDEALAVLERALALDPAHGEALFNRGVVRQSQGEFSAALADWQATLRTDPAHRVARSNLIFALQYEPAMDGPALLAAAREYDRLYGHPAQRYRAWDNARDPARRLRIGYVSPDFREHSVAQYLEPLLAAHNPAAVEIFAFAEMKRSDAVTERLRRLVAQWRNTAGLSDEAVARQVRDDRIDILVDLAGHTGDNRLGVFALKPAPVQATWLGYPGTTGLAAMDYRLTDALADPPATEAHSSETLVRLPHGFHCWQRPADAPEIAALAPDRPPTFGSFNNVQKLSAEAIALWAELLRRVPDARLKLKSSWLSRAPVLDAIRAAFALHGIDAERIQAAGWIAAASSHLAAYGEIDVALDPVPYNGTTTTIEALWMGVPVVALEGARHAARVGVSVLTHAGAPELIATTKADYVDIAARLVRDRERLVQYRTTLRERMSASPLLDVRRFARDIEAAYRTMWQRWCAETRA
jgi:predicted O-linked N-acetylglucosamine transferase (SPINDLY family)